MKEGVDKMRKSDFLTLSFSNGGRFSSKGLWQHSTRVIDSYELILVTKGTIYMQQNGQEYTLSAGDYLWLSPNLFHGGTAPSKMPIEFYWLHFIPDTQNGLEIPKEFANLPTSSRLFHPSTVIHAARQILHYSETPGYPNEICNHLMYVLLAELLIQGCGKTTPNRLVSEINEYVRSYSCQLLSVSMVAEHFGYNADYISRLLKKHLGCNLQQLIITERLNLAKFLLQTSSYSISQIANDLGYEDSNLFVKFFCHHMKITPSAYRDDFSKFHTNHK